MQKKLEYYNDFAKRLASNCELEKKLETKIGEIADWLQVLKSRKITVESEYKEGVRNKIKGLISQKELDGYQAAIQKVDQDIRIAEDEAKAAEEILDETLEEKKQLKIDVQTALYKFKEAAYKNCLNKIPDALKEMFYDAVAIARHLAGTGYNRALEDAFPMEAYDRNNLRWKNFIEKYSIPD